MGVASCVGTKRDKLGSGLFCQTQIMGQGLEEFTSHGELRAGLVMGYFGSLIFQCFCVSVCPSVSLFYKGVLYVDRTIARGLWTSGSYIWLVSDLKWSGLSEEQCACLF